MKNSTRFAAPSRVKALKSSSAVLFPPILKSPSPHPPSPPKQATLSSSSSPIEQKQRNSMMQTLKIRITSPYFPPRIKVWLFILSTAIIIKQNTALSPMNSMTNPREKLAIVKQSLNNLLKTYLQPSQSHSTLQTVENPLKPRKAT
jgi:hypothetical protein